MVVLHTKSWGPRRGPLHPGLEGQTTSSESLNPSPATLHSLVVVVFVMAVMVAMVVIAVMAVMVVMVHVHITYSRHKAQEGS